MLGILIPTRGLVSIEFAFTLVDIVSSIGEPVRLMFNRGYGVDTARNMLVALALADPEIDRIMFLSDDVIPARYDPESKSFVYDPTAVKQLLRHKKPCVSALVWTKQGTPGAYMLKDREDRELAKYLSSDEIPPVSIPIEPTDEMIEKGAEFVADAVAMEMIVIDKKIFNEIDQPWFKYVVKYIPEKKIYVEFGEDIWFFNKLKKKGCSVLVDASVIALHEVRGWIAPRNKVYYRVR